MGTCGRTVPSAATKAKSSSARWRSRTTHTNSPVVGQSAPCTTRRALRPLISTTACSPRLLQPAAAGETRAVLSYPPPRPHPQRPTAWAPAITASFFGVGRIGPAQHVLGSLPAIVQLVQGTANGPFADRVPGVAQLRPQQGYRPSGRTMVPRLWVLGQQRLQHRASPRDQGHEATAVWSSLHPGQPIASPRCRPPVDAAQAAPQGGATTAAG